MAPNILVLGGAFTDMVFTRVPRMPEADESVNAEQFSETFGGKGFNQAIAAAAIGGNVQLCTAIGDDRRGQEILAELSKRNVGQDAIEVLSNTPTPVCCVMLDLNGHARFISAQRNCHASVDVDFIERQRAAFENSDVVLLTLDYPIDVLSKAISYAKAGGALVICNPAPLPKPAQQAHLELLKNADLIIPNTHEAELLLGVSIPDDEAKAETLACELHRSGVPSVCVTAGRKGSVLVDSNGTIKQPSFLINAQNTAGASDLFCGALAHYYTTMPPQEALRHASAAVSLWLKGGERLALPSAEDVERFLAAVI